MEWSKESIVSRRFSKKVMGGISEFEVRDFLHVLAEEIRHLRQLNINQGKKLADKEELIKDYRDREHILRQSIASAQEVADKIRKDAEKRAQLILDGAGGKSEAMIQDARHSLQTVYNDIADLKRLYLQFKTSLRASLQAQMELLEQGPLFTTPLPFDESASGASEGGASQNIDGGAGYGGSAPEGGPAEAPGQNFGPGQSFRPAEAGLESGGAGQPAEGLGGSALEPEGASGASEASGANPAGAEAGRKNPGGDFPGEAFSHKDFARGGGRPQGIHGNFQEDPESLFQRGAFQESEEPSGKKRWKWPGAQSSSVRASFVEASSAAPEGEPSASSEFSAEPGKQHAPAPAQRDPAFQSLFQSPANRSSRERPQGRPNKQAGPANSPPEAPAFPDSQAAAQNMQAQPKPSSGSQSFFEGQDHEMRALKSSLRSLNKDFS